MLQVLLHYSMEKGYKCRIYRGLQRCCERTENLCVFPFTNFINPCNFNKIRYLQDLIFFRNHQKPCYKMCYKITPKCVYLRNDFIPFLSFYKLVTMLQQSNTN